MGRSSGAHPTAFSGTHKCQANLLCRDLSGSCRRTTASGAARLTELSFADRLPLKGEQHDF